MRYLTKEWYLDCQRTNFGFGFTADARAAGCDEMFYNDLYREQERAYIADQREVHNLDPFFLLEISGEEKNDAMQQAFENRAPFSEEDCRAEFAARQQYYLQELNTLLPPEILAQVPDLRVLALGVCSPELAGVLEEFAAAAQARVDAALEAAAAAQQAEPIPPEIEDHICLHDASITAFAVDKDVTMSFTPCFTEDHQVVFHDAQILKLEGELVGAQWLYEEVYAVEGGYELHALLTGAPFCELILRCSGMTFSR